MASQQDERVRQLERELDSLRAYLEEKDHSLVKAAEVGKALLRENEALEERLSEAAKESTKKIDELEQERFSRQQKLECQRSALLTVQQDMESVKTDLRREYEMREEHLKQAQSKKVCESELLCSDLRGENDRLEAQLKTSREKTAALEERVREMTEQMESANTSSGLQPELRELEKICKQERCEREELQGRLSDAQEECSLLGMEVEELTGKVERLTDECQERSDQANEWYKALQTSKEQVMELTAELETMKMEAGNGHDMAGNSLFGEVDDRRLQVERKYVSLQVKHDSLERRHASMSQQYKRLKGEMSSMLCQFSVVGADVAHIRRLEVALRQAQSEKETLLTKLHKLEKQQAAVLASQEKLRYVAAFGDKKEYIALIELQLNQARKENNTTTKELEMKGLRLVWETQKLRETEAKLHRKEQEMARGKKEFSMMKLKLQELQEKLDKADTSCKQQEAQVDLLEKELHLLQRRKPQQKVVSTSQPDTATPPNTTHHQSTLTTPSSGAITSSKDGAGCGGRGVETASEKENRLLPTHSSRREKKTVKLDTVPINFLEDVEREFQKQSNTCNSTKTGHSSNTFRRNIPISKSVYPRTASLDSKVNQCPQQ